MRTIALTLAVVFVAATAVSLLRLTDWWVRAFDFPRAQIAVLGVAVLVTYLFLWDVRQGLERLLLVALAASVVYQGWRILPYTPLYPKQVLRAETADPEDMVSVLICNVYMDNRRSDPIVRMVGERQPDLFLAIETNAWWQQQLRPIEPDFPFVVAHPLDNTYGMILYSRLPLVEPEIEFLVADDVPSIHTGVRLRSGQVLRFHGLHPKPPAPAEATDTVERDGELLIVAKRARAHNGPTIATGDLNDVAWSSTTSLMQRVSGLLDPRIGRGVYSTFHARIPFLRWPLDHVFHSNHFLLVELERLDYVGSDHFPVWVRLALKPEAKLIQETPEQKPGDESRTEDKIEEALDPEAEGKEGEGEGEAVSPDPDKE